MMLMLTLGTSAVFTSCGGSDDDEFVPSGNKEEGKKDDGKKDEGSKDDGLPTDKTPAGVEIVDLGLSVKWASCNLGATAPEDYGDLIAWGETEGNNAGKKTFTWATYKLTSNGKSTGLTKYTYSDGQPGALYGEGDKKYVLDNTGSQIDDAARAQWGGKWRMPTQQEWDELIQNCKWTWDKIGKNTGYTVTSNKNGKSIFLPAAGWWDNINFHDGNIVGNYWASTLNFFDDAGCAFILHIDATQKTCSTSRERYLGYSIRAVCE